MHKEIWFVPPTCSSAVRWSSSSFGATGVRSAINSVTLNEALPAIAATGGTLVALTPDTGEHTHATFHDLNLAFPVLSDIDSATALEFGTNYLVPDAMRQVQEANGINLAVRHGDGAWFLPMPATFIADRHGVLRFVYASGDVTDRLEPEELVAKVREFSGGP